MTDLFVDLYRYRQREKKNNLEDWLTECLAAVFRSLDRRQWENLLKGITNAEPAVIESLLNEELPEVRTQVYAGEGYGIPDLIIYHSRHPIIIFENKVAHGVAADGNGTGEKRHQLHRYAEWLDKNTHPLCNVKQLIFLTHLTRTPDDFRAVRAIDECPYRGIPRRAETWGTLARLMLEITREEGDRSLSSGLAAALYQILENENMSNQFPDTNAMAALQVFLSQGAAMENLLDRMWEEVAGAVNSSNMSARLIEAELEFGRFTASRYVNRIEQPATRVAFLMTGIWFPEAKDTWTAAELDGQQPVEAQVFLLFGDDKDNVFRDINGVPEAGWLRPCSDFLCLKPLHEFSGSPDERAGLILEWLGKKAQALRPFLIEKGLVA